MFQQPTCNREAEYCGQRKLMFRKSERNKNLFLREKKNKTVLTYQFVLTLPPLHSQCRVNFGSGDGMRQNEAAVHH